MGSAVALLSRATLRIKLTRRPRPIFEALSDWLNTDTFLYESSTYLPTHYLKMLKPLGVSSVDTGPKIYIEKGSEARANSFMQSKNVTKRPIVAISITAGNKIKEWGDDKFSELAEAIVSNFDVSLMWLGGSRDEKRITHFVKTLSKNAEDRSFVVAGADLRDVPALLRHSALYIAVDTGPIHIAHALGVPLVDIVGPVDPGELVPRGPKCLAIFPEASIEPSVFAFKKNGRLEEQKAALDSITVERVFREIDAFIRTNKLFE
jgi:ADP-heptose:LPS heptosyltransferase